MKRLGGIWLRLVSFENLLLAYRKARRGKRTRPGVAEFGLDLERQIIALQCDLKNGEYHAVRCGTRVWSSVETRV